MKKLVIVIFATLLFLVQITPVPAGSSNVYFAFMGPSGGFEGKELYEQPSNTSSKITAVGVRSGEFIDGIEVHTVDIGACGQPKAESASQKLGGGGGKLTWLNLDCDEYIKYVSGTYGEFVDSLTIGTTKGHKMTWGGSGGVAAFYYDVPLPHEIGSIVGFWGRFGEYVNALGIVIAYKWSS